MRLGQTSAIYFVSKLLTSIIGFLATIYFTRTLGEAVYGYYSITLALVTWLSLVQSIGFGQAMIKRMSEDESSDEFFITGSAIKSILTAIVIVGVLVFQDLINSYVGRPVAEFVVLILAAKVFSNTVNSALKGTHRVHIYAPLSTLKKGLRSIFMVLLVYLGWELTGMLFGYALGTALVGMIGLVIVRPSFTRPSRRHFTRLIEFAKYSWLGSMQKKTFSNVDILVLGLFVPAGLTGIYAVAYSLSRFLEIFGSAIKNTLFPEMSRLSSQDKFDQIASLTEDALRFSGLFLVPGLVGAAVLGDRLLSVYGPGFDIGHWVLVILIFALLVYTATRQLLNTLNAVDRPDLAFRANAVFIVANITLNVLFVWQIGWFGAAVATAISAAVGFAISWRYIQRIVTVQFPIREIGRQWVAAIVMGAAVLPARSLGEANLAWVDDFNAVFVVLLVGLGAAIYFAVLLTISSRFRSTVSRNVPYDLPLIQ